MDSETIAYLREKSDTENEFRKPLLELHCQEIQNQAQAHQDFQVLMQQQQVNAAILQMMARFLPGLKN